MPEGNSYDEFSGTTGLLDDFDGVVIDAFFSTSPNYNNGQTLCLHLELATNDDSEAEVVQMYPTGNDWASYDDGETCEHPKGAKQRFNVNSAIQKLIAAAISVDKAAETEIRRRSAQEFGGFGHRYAKLWLGTKWHWNIVTEHFEFTDKQGKEVKRDVNRVLPTAWLGVVSEDEIAALKAGESKEGSGEAEASAADSTAAAPAQDIAAAAPSAAAATNGTSFISLDSIPPDIRAKLKILAQSQPYPEFVDSALEIPGLIGNQVVVSMLGDEAMYESLKA